MEAKLKTALQTTINDYYAIDKEIHDPSTKPARGLQLFAAKEAVKQVLQHFMNAEYIEHVNERWRIKVIVIESTPSSRRGLIRDTFDKATPEKAKDDRF